MAFLFFRYHRLFLFLAAFVILGGLASAVDKDCPLKVNAFHREGQSFLTWNEDQTVDGEWYNIYLCPEPIGPGALSTARKIARVPEHSGKYRWVHDRLRAELNHPEWLHGIQLEDDVNTEKLLADGTGVFVRTVKTPGKRYYAVTMERDGQEDRVFCSGGNVTGEPITEHVNLPGAILVGSLGQDRYVYLYFTDYDVWNPDGIDDNWEGYAHICLVALPGEWVAGKKYPLALRLHAFNAWSAWNRAGLKNRVVLAPLDYYNTWWYGFSDSLKPVGVRNNRPLPAPPQGMVVNFTEQRVLQAVRWLTAGPHNCPIRVDPEQIEVAGRSMGATGVNIFAMRNGKTFASGKSHLGVVNWALPRALVGFNIDRLVGTRQFNAMTRENKPVFDLLNMPKFLAANPALETPFIDMGNGIMDKTILFHGVPDYWHALEKGRHPYAAGWDLVGHSAGARSDGPMKTALIRKDESLPAFSNASCNTPINSGIAIHGLAKSIMEKSLSIMPGSIRSPYGNEGLLPKGLEGMRLVLYPSMRTHRWFTIKSNTDTHIIIEDGNMKSYEPEPSSWHIRRFKRQNDRMPNAGEIKEIVSENKKIFVICDGEPRGARNGYLAWSSSTQNFAPDSAADDIVDEKNTWAVNIRLEKNFRLGEWKEDAAFVDITPRRIKRFRPAVGSLVGWRNISFADPDKPKTVESGTVTVDKHRLVTVVNFMVGKEGWGNRLVLSTTP